MPSSAYSPAPGSPAYSPQFYGAPQLQPASWQNSIGNFFDNLGNNVGSYMSQQVYPNMGSDFITTPQLQAARPNDPYAFGSAPAAAGQAVGNAASTAIGSLEGFIGGLARGGGAILGLVIIAGALAYEGRSKRA